MQSFFKWQQRSIHFSPGIVCSFSLTSLSASGVLTFLKTQRGSLKSPIVPSFSSQRPVRGSTGSPCRSKISYPGIGDTSQHGLNVSLQPSCFYFTLKSFHREPVTGPEHIPCFPKSLPLLILFLCMILYPCLSLLILQDPTHPFIACTLDHLLGEVFLGLPPLLNRIQFSSFLLLTLLLTLLTLLQPLLQLLSCLYCARGHYRGKLGEGHVGPLCTIFATYYFKIKSFS